MTLNSFFDLISFPKKIKRQKVLELILAYQVPSYPKDNSSVIENCNLDSIPNTVEISYAITTDKCIMRSFPTSRVFKKSEYDVFNRLNLTALHINSNVLILHYSLDRRWCFIVSEIYSGWVESDKVVIVNVEMFKAHLYREDYVTIIDALLIYDNLHIDMGTKLKYDDGNVLIYTQDGYQKIDIKQDAYVKGSLPFTKEMVYMQAFKYLNFPYNRGDDLDKIDCSAFIRNVFLSCGLILPRDTGDILKILNSDEKLISNDKDIQVLHFKGHIALYLFTIENKHYFIHANGRHMRVTIDHLNPSYLDVEDILAISHLPQ